MIVVGLDGSEGSRLAFRWALSEAALRNTTVQAVATWQIPSYTYTGIAMMPPVTGLAEATEANLAEIVADEIARVSEPESSVKIEQVVAEGPAAWVLIDRSSQAELLVVGSRGHGGFRGLLLGSVSHQCASHARCPVVVVPDPSRD